MRKLVVRGLSSAALLLPMLAFASGAEPAQAAEPGRGAATAAGVQAPLSPSEAAALSKNVTDKVIVVLKDQPSASTIKTSQADARQASVTAAQRPVLAELQQTAATRVRPFSLVDAISATVSPGEASRLAANPAVAEVVPDSPVRGPDLNPATEARRAATGVAPSTLPIPPGACPAPGQPAYVGEELSLINADSNSSSQPTARSLGFTGAGVKVAFMAEGIDINNPDFIRPDGSHVFADYQDFSGDGTAAPTSAGEAFLDASAIAAQGDTYNVQDFGTVPLAAPCEVKVEGVAPGASLVGLKVFAQNGYSTTSGLVQAVDYAVTVDHVNVLNESLGYNPFPTVQSQDLLEQFNDAAVAAGTTVTVAAGDAGPANTIGSPDTDPHVINVGASTNFRFYAETGSDGYVPPLATHGWLSDNISGLSSGGFSEPGPVDDLVAPGDTSFAACTPDPSMYQSCVNLAGAASPVEFSGGTSESSPLTAGAAALVIQAFRQSHNGATPSPAQVKQIIVSTADDLGHPATEQGAGLLDAYRAVLAAQDVPAGRTTPAQGQQILMSTGQLQATAAPGTPEAWPVTITNVGAEPTLLSLRTRALGPALDTQRRSVVLSDNGPQFYNNFAASEENYRTVTFTVAPGRARLQANIAYQGNPQDSFVSDVDVVLIDPQGNFAADATPQGVGNADQAEVRYPAAGTWTAIIFSNTTANAGTVGTVLFQAQTFDFQTFGTVTPAKVAIAPGASSTVWVQETTPAAPGDQSGAVIVTNLAGQASTVPVSVRSLVDLSSGGAFSGNLTGGNGRQSDLGQTAYYQFDVPNGSTAKTLKADVLLAGGATDPVVAYLVDPQGQTLSVANNAVVTTLTPSTTKEKGTSAVEVAATAPMAGRWTLILNFAPAITGNQLVTPYSGTVALVSALADGSDLPTSSSTSLPAGKAHTVTITVHNTSPSPQDYFVDPRLSTQSPVWLAAQSAAAITLPMASTQTSPSWLVPANTSAILMYGISPKPLTFDWGPGIGDPDLGATSAGQTATGVWAAAPITSGLWFADPSELGPYGANPPPSEPVALYALARTQTFDKSVTSSTGDLWLQAVTPASPVTILTVPAGATATIPVTIAPTAASGTVVSGTLYVDELSEIPASTANALNFAPAQSWFPQGTPVAALPYTYRVS
jgi:hypothetical protein